MPEPTGEEEAGTGQPADPAQVAEPWPAAAVAAHSFVHLSFLVVPSCYLLPSPIYCAAAAGIGIEGVGSLQV